MELNQIILIVMHLCLRILRQTCQRRIIFALGQGLLSHLFLHVDAELLKYTLYLLLDGLFDSVNLAELLCLLSGRCLVFILLCLLLTIIYRDLRSKIPSCLLATIVFLHEVVLAGCISEGSPACMSFVVRRIIILREDSVLLWVQGLLHEEDFVLRSNWSLAVFGLLSSLIFLAFLPLFLICLDLWCLSHLLIRITVDCHD